MRRLQDYYAEEMDAYGYGRMTFRYEVNPLGEPLVHRVIGQHGDSHYHDNTLVEVANEIQEVYELDRNIYVIVVDYNSDGIGTWRRPRERNC